MSSNEPELTVIHVAIAVLNIYPSHARRHDNRKLNFLTKSIREFGLANPIIIDELDTILSGHMRARAYEELGLKTIPAIRLTHLTPDQKRAFVIAANRLPELGSWDKRVLKQELKILSDITCEIDLDITGWDIGEIDLILGHDEREDEEEVFPELPAEPFTRPGDLYIMDKHRLYCGSCLDEASWQLLMDGELAQICITDSPYNVPVKGHVTSKDHKEFAMASGEMTIEQFIQFLNEAYRLMAQFSEPNALHYLFIDHRHLRELFAAADPVYDRQVNLIVWAKSNGGLGSHYRSRHELVALYQVGKGKPINNVQLGKYGRNRSNVWQYAGANAFGKNRDEALADHPTPKPVEMIADALLDSSNPGDICIDGFGGSGTLILAAQQTGRRARVIELEPGYCDLTVRRWEQMTGRQAVLKRRASGAPIALPAPKQLLLPPPTNGGVS